MDRIAPHTRLKPGKESEYEEVHDHPANVPCQARMAGLLEVDSGIKLVWELP